MAKKKSSKYIDGYSDDELIDRSVFDHIKEKAAAPPVTSTGVNKGYALFIIGIMFFSVVLFMGWIPHIGNQGEEMQTFNTADSSFETMTIFSTDSCSCCHLYVDYIDSMGINSERVSMNTVNNLKEELGIPTGSTSCHTSKYGTYFIEGHVPIQAVNRLMSEKPDIDGISLPEMPKGSPGMSGDKAEPFEIQMIKNGEVVGIFMTI